MTKQLCEMMKKLIDGEYDCNDFSYDFPNALMEVKDENLLRILDDMPEICAAYDPYKTDEDDLLNDTELIEKIKPIYEIFVQRTT